MKKSLAIIASVLIITPVLAAGYDRFVSPRGGVFCPDFDGKTIRLDDQNVCISTGVSPATSFSHMGRESMYLVKSGSPVFAGCVWVDATDSNITLNGIDYFGPKVVIRTGGDARYSCFGSVHTEISRQAVN